LVVEDIIMFPKFAIYIEDWKDLCH